MEFLPQSYPVRCTLLTLSDPLMAGDALQVAFLCLCTHQWFGLCVLHRTCPLVPRVTVCLLPINDEVRQVASFVPTIGSAREVVELEAALQSPRRMCTALARGTAVFTTTHLRLQLAEQPYLGLEVLDARVRFGLDVRVDAETIHTQVLATGGDGVPGNIERIQQLDVVVPPRAAGLLRCQGGDGWVPDTTHAAPCALDTGFRQCGPDAPFHSACHAVPCTARKFLRQGHTVGMRALTMGERKVPHDDSDDVSDDDSDDSTIPPMPPLMCMFCHRRVTDGWLRGRYMPVQGCACPRRHRSPPRGECKTPY